MKISENLIFITILAILFFAAILWFVPKWQVQKLSTLPNTRNEEQALSLEKDKLKFEDEARKTLAQIIGGGVVLLGLLVTFGTYLLGIDKQDLDREAQMTDRFSKAITHIGDEKQAVRIGGLYELERVAKDSPKDSETIKKVILSYLHNNYSIKDEKTESIILSTANRELSNGFAISFYSSNTELQTLITIIQGMSNDDDRLDFSRLNLLDKSIARGNFSRSNFSASNLSGSNLFASNFSYSNFKSANLSRATADLQHHVKIGNALVQLVMPDAVKLNFTEADLTNASIIESNLSEAIFAGATLTKATLTKSIFYKSDFREAKLDNVNAAETIFNDANLTGANFFKANLSGAKFYNAKLDSVNFTSADLSNCEGLTLEKMKKVLISDDTKLPDELKNHKKELLSKPENKVQ